jgi:glycosyltransferase involved in cell wall biosynthesis
MRNIGISIIIPCYQAGSFIVDAVKSIVTQPFHHPFEVIVIDDGSNDENTCSALKTVESFKNVRIIRFLENQGVQRARNAGLRLAQYDYVFTIDADDCLNTDTSVLRDGTYADRAIDILCSSPNVAFVHGMTSMFGDYNGLTISAYPTTESLILHKHHAQNSIVYRKSDAIGAGYYNEAIQKWQDWSFAVAILNFRQVAGLKNDIVFLNKPYYLYRIHSTVKRISTTEVNEKEMIRRTFLSSPEIFRKYYPGVNDVDIPDHVLMSKPDKLVDLLYVAANDISVARNLIEIRGFRLIGEKERGGIP